jgi:hypothetical protein
MQSWTNDVSPFGGHQRTDRRALRVFGERRESRKPDELSGLLCSKTRAPGLEARGPVCHDEVLKVRVDINGVC